MSAENEIQTGATIKQLHGVGGWLLIFIIGTFGNVILNLAIVLQGEKLSWGGNIIVYNPFQLVLLAVFAFATGVALLTIRNKNAVLLTQIYLAVSLVSNIIVAIIGLKAPSGYYIADREGVMIRGIIQAVVINLVWQTYFLRSKRVKATYPPRGGTGEAVQLSPGKSLSSIFDRKIFGINYFTGIGFFLAVMISGILWILYYPLIQSYPLEFPPASYFLAYRIPLTILYSVLLVLLLYTLRNDWLIAVSMGLGTMTLGYIARIIFSGTTFGPLHINGAFNLLFLMNGFLWSFFLVLGIIFALKTWGLKLWSVIIWVCLGVLASDLIGQFLNALTIENFRFDLLGLPMDVIDGAITGSILYLSIMLHFRKKKA
ncbi:MAG: DUF2569 family protein [Candidatus Aminicenantes bacterium]|nr:DUF2569 family protein [Candidatus Aminicenantes bacterium]